jgi:adenine-specific DNA-methyltransferase
VANYLDSLIDKIGEPSLRDALRAEIAALRDNKEFGLVFQRHLPETIRLPSYRVKRGVNVQQRSNPGGPIWRVVKVTNGQATLSRHDGDGPISEAHAVTDLVVVREFGEPMYPGLRSVGRVERGGDKPYHVVMNAENYHAVETLIYTSEGKVDVIYIDPPYNSGARDWTYNNDYVDRTDDYRHSKWLSFMERRLLLAQRLLQPNGVLLS